MIEQGTQKLKNKVENKWGSCDTEDGRTAYLALLNRNAQKTYSCACALSIWEYGKDKETRAARAGINNLELVDDDEEPE